MADARACRFFAAGRGRYNASVQQSGWKRGFRRAIRIALVIGGLWGGWLAASALNDRRGDVPRRVVPPSQPSAGMPK